MNATETVYKALKDNGNMLKAGEIAEQTGIDKKDVDKAIKQLVKEEKVNSPKKCYYSACK